MLKQQGASKLDGSLASLLSTEAADIPKNIDCSVLFPSQWKCIWFELLISFLGQKALLKLKLAAVLWQEQEREISGKSRCYHHMLPVMMTDKLKPNSALCYCDTRWTGINYNHAEKKTSPLLCHLLVMLQDIFIQQILDVSSRKVFGLLSAGKY